MEEILTLHLSINSIKPSLGIEPVITLYMDIKPDLGLTKAKELDKESYGKSGDRIERESVEFHNNVRKGYLAQAKNIRQE